MNSMTLPIDLALKSVLVLALITLAMPLLRRASAAMRHFVWLQALIGLAALPLLSTALPGWNILPSWRSSDQPTALKMPSAATEDAEYSPGQAIASIEMNHATPANVRVPQAAFVTATEWIWLVWLGGTLLALIPLVLAVASLRRLERRATVVTDEAWLDLQESSMRRLQMNRSVTLLRSSDRQMPMTWGYFRPRIMLSVGADVWPLQRCELALLHELAHVKRGDNIVNYITHAVCALYWFNPLVWIAARRMRAEREQACDDLVLASGQDAGDYADELLELATTLDSGIFSPVAASPMARRSTLEERLLAILDGKRNRAALNRSTINGVVAIISAILVPLSMLRGSSAQAQTTNNPTASSASTSGEEQDISKSYVVALNGTLSMNVEQGNIEIASSERNNVEVSVHRQVKNASDAEAAALLEEHPITFDQNGANVTITSKGPEVKSGSWFRRGPSLEVEYKITTPRKYNFSLATGGGNVRIDTIEGSVQTKTSGGNLRLTHIDGPVSARTSGGNITVADCQTLDAESSGGNLQLSALHGMVTAKTGGGGAKVSDCAGALSLKSGGGNFTIDNFAGSSLQADTGGGSISADLVTVPKESCLFRSGGGGIRLKVPENLAVNLDASTGGGTVSCELPVLTGGVLKSTDSLKGTINGGGPEIRIRTGGGDIKISKR